MLACSSEQTKNTNTKPNAWVLVFFRASVLLHQHFEVWVIVTTRYAANATLYGLDSFITNPEGEQRANDKTDRATKSCTKSEQDIPCIFVAFH
jgi:hypothetical protein